MGVRVPKHDRYATGERIRHWLIVTALTLAGVLLADSPVLSHTRDRIYLWLEQRLLRSNRSVVVVAIDDNEFWRGEPGGVRPLDRRYLANLLTKIAAADPTVIGLDVGLETNTPNKAPEWEALPPAATYFLTTLHTIVRTCPLVLPRTIEGKPPFHPEYDLFDATPFPDDAFVAYGHTNCALDLRQIPTRVIMENGRLLDSFALAVTRTVVRDVRAELNDPREPWPYSFFLPNSAFAPKNAPVGPDGLLTAHAVLAATPTEVRKWLRHQVVIVGGTWHATPHGGDLQDGHATPIGNLPGVLVHANYVQSLLWDAMYAMPHAWRLSIEVLLSLAISIVFLRARRWRRLLLVLAMLITVVLLTWVFSAAIGIFFDMVVPIAFVGVHAIWEGASETLRLDFRRKVPHAEHVFTAFAILLAIAVGTIFALHEHSAVDARLATEQRLQVSELRMAAPDLEMPRTTTAHSIDGASVYSGRSNTSSDQRAVRNQLAAIKKVRHIALALKKVHSDLEETQARYEVFRHEIDESPASAAFHFNASRSHRGTAPAPNNTAGVGSTSTPAVISGPAAVDSSGRAYTSSSVGSVGNSSVVGTNTNVNLIPKKTKSEVTVAEVPAPVETPVIVETPAPAPVVVETPAPAPVIETPAPISERRTALLDKTSRVNARVRALQIDEDRVLRELETRALSLPTSSKSTGPPYDVLATAKQFESTIAHERAFIAKGGHNTTTYQEGAAKLDKALQRFADHPGDDAVPRLLTDADRIFTREQPHKATADPITSWRDTVLPPGRALGSVLDCFSPAAITNLSPRAEGDHVVVLVPAHAFDLGANLSDDTIRQMRPIMSALLDDPTLRVNIALAPTNVSKETIDYFAPRRIESVTRVLVGVGIEASRITSDRRSVAHSDESNAVNLTLTLYRQ
jgi:hypothetical protein